MEGVWEKRELLCSVTNVGGWEIDNHRQVPKSGFPLIDVLQKSAIIPDFLSQKKFGLLSSGVYRSYVFFNYFNKKSKESCKRDHPRPELNRDKAASMAAAQHYSFTSPSSFHYLNFFSIHRETKNKTDWRRSDSSKAKYKTQLA